MTGVQTCALPIYSYAARMVNKGLIAEDIVKNLPKALEQLDKKYN